MQTREASCAGGRPAERAVPGTRRMSSLEYAAAILDAAAAHLTYSVTLLARGSQTWTGDSRTDLTLN